MLYSNPEYFIFLPVVWLLYYFGGRTQDRRLWILISASLFFYMWAGVFDALVFTFVLMVSWGAVWMAERARSRQSCKLYLAGGMIIMLLHLCFWKYVPWLCSTVQEISPSFLGGRKLSFPLPVGISFFTLQGMAYLIDYWRNEAQYIKLKDYLLFKSFFPQLVAGPIVRMRQIGPQLQRLPDVGLGDVREGLMLFLIGFFKKVAVADRMATVVDPVFANPQNYTSGSIFLALLAYSVQIWGDFSGYTDMGRGAAKMFGINLPENFFSPYLSRSPAEFWRRWHVTLSQWIRDYIYIPLGGACGSLARTAVVVVVTMALSGLWHGAAFTFLIWGFYHGALLVLERIAKHFGLNIFDAKWSVVLTFVLITFGWVFFRSESMASLVTTLQIMSAQIPGGAMHVSTSSVVFGALICLLFQLFTYTPFGNPVQQSWLQRLSLRARSFVGIDSPVVEGVLFGAVAALILTITLLMRVSDASNKFIYFQF